MNDEVVRHESDIKSFPGFFYALRKIKAQSHIFQMEKEKRGGKIMTFIYLESALIANAIIHHINSEADVRKDEKKGRVRDEVH